MAITWPGSRAAVTLSPSVGSDLLGCINRTREKERQGKEALYNHAAYVLVRNHKSHYRSVPLRAIFRRIRRTGKLHLQWQVVKTHADTICTGPKSNKKRRREEERKKKTSKSDPVSISRLPNLCSNDHHSRSSYLTA